jgi:hypothetical protein
MRNLIFVSILMGVLNAKIKATTTNIQATTTFLQVSNLIVPPTNSKIQVALLLDTSNSMDGLIDQAKSRIWEIVNTLTTLKYQGITPEIEIALYEYGNDGLDAGNGYIRQVTPLTKDLDLISEKLFALKTNGGSEFCGNVIQTSLNELKWEDGNNTMKLIYISGNEPFNQGPVDYKKAISKALNNKVYVNTIYCGDKEAGIRELWQNGAVIGEGKYFNINSNAKVEYIVTPYDNQINACNDKLNKTYIGYGKRGYSKKANQIAQDNNAAGVSSSNSAERVVSKSKAAYSNEEWDMVDSYKKDVQSIQKMSNEDLPTEFKGKSKTEITKIIDEKAKERDKIQKEIGELAVKRQKYINDEAKKKTNKTDDLGEAMKASILELANKNGFKG